MFEKPVINLIKFSIKDILSLDDSGEDPTTTEETEESEETEGACDFEI